MDDSCVFDHAFHSTLHSIALCYNNPSLWQIVKQYIGYPRAGQKRLYYDINNVAQMFYSECARAAVGTLCDNVCVSEGQLNKYQIITFGISQKCQTSDYVYHVYYDVVLL